MRRVFQPMCSLGAYARVVLFLQHRQFCRITLIALWHKSCVGHKECLNRSRQTLPPKQPKWRHLRGFWQLEPAAEGGAIELVPGTVLDSIALRATQWRQYYAPRPENTQHAGI